MRHFTSFFAILFISFGSNAVRACDPAQVPFSELLNHYHPTLNSAVEGYFISPKTFKVTKSYYPEIKVGSENKVFEYGPFGNSCELYEVESGTDIKFTGAKKSRILFLVRGRSKNGKLVTPIYQGQGVNNPVKHCNL